MMTTQRKVLIQPQDAPIAVGALYTAVNCTTQIDNCSVTNTTAANETISIYRVPFGQTPGDTNLMGKEVSIAAGAYYNVVELVGKDLAVGDFIAVEASATGLTIYAGGRETT